MTESMWYEFAGESLAFGVLLGACVAFAACAAWWLLERMFDL